MKTNNPLIVTRHAGAVTWLAARGITGEVIAHATPEAVTGRTVYGVLPLHLAARTAEVWSVDLPNLSADLRGQDLTPEQMDAAGATLTGYTVRPIPAAPAVCPVTGDAL